MKTIPINEIIREKNTHCYLSGEMAQFNNNDNFARVEVENNTFIYIDWGNLSKDVDYSILSRQKGKVIDALIKEGMVNYTRKELQEFNTDRVYLELVSYFYDDKRELLEFCREYGIKTERENYTEIELTGYSQGDYAKILVNTKEYKEVLGVEFEEEKMKTYLHNLFYDVPQVVRLEFLGEEYISEQFDGYYPSWKDDEHNYDKEKFIKELVEYYKDQLTDLEFFTEQLKKFLPEELEYKDY